MIGAQHGIAGGAPSVEREEVRMNVLTRQAVLAITSLAVIVSGCGTLMHSDKQSVTIFSLPPGAPRSEPQPAAKGSRHSTTVRLNERMGTSATTGMER